MKRGDKISFRFRDKNKKTKIITCVITFLDYSQFYRDKLDMMMSMTLGGWHPIRRYEKKVISENNNYDTQI